MKWSFLRNVLLKALGLFVIMNLIFAATAPLDVAGGLSLYNHVFPGRERFPFGENPVKSYNLSLYNLEAMFAAHGLSAGEKPQEEFRVFVMGDSSVWGTLLRPQEILTGQLNALHLSASCNRVMHFYNLGYPTVSLTKDVMLLEKAMPYQPDLVIWLVTLEAFPWEKQFSSPLVENNLPQVLKSMQAYNVHPQKLPVNEVGRSKLWGNTLVSQRRALADLIRLQIYGVMWAATGIDQEYFENYPPAQRDFEQDDNHFQAFNVGELERKHVAFEVLEWGSQVAGSVPVLVVNEPMLISNGKNSNNRYNFFYPRWAYDQYRDWMQEVQEYSDWHYLDLWDLVPNEEFTNSAIHLTPQGSKLLAEALAEVLQRSDLEMKEP